MSTIDHYAEAERLLGLARTTQEWVDDGHGGNHHVPEVIAAAQVHATLATVQRNACPHDWIAPTKIGDGEGNEWVRVECALCGAVDDRPDFRTIPWPPSDELRTRCADAVWRRLRDEFGPQVSGYLTAGQYETIAAAVFDELDGAS